MKALKLVLLVTLLSAVAAARAQGEYSATGTLYITFDIGIENHLEGVLFARFIPDKESLDQFPAVTSAPVPGPVSYISFEAPTLSLDALVGSAEAERLSNDWNRIIALPVTLVLKDFRALVECDARSYKATLVAAQSLGMYRVASRDSDAPVGC